ncbi:MAG: phosphatase PAP2 family protein [bacterium]|jgi:undecaprenyl-diphosphatase|nr:phosphatase PAP2 family protein [bacterium]
MSNTWTSDPGFARLWTLARAALGATLLVVLLAVAVLASTAPITRYDLRVDEILAGLRFQPATTLALDLTRAAQEAVGLAVLAAGLAVLCIRRRWWDASRLALMAGTAWMLGLAVKDLVDRPRPPASLWLLAPDPSGSFPSGHAITAAVVALVVVAASKDFGLIRLLAAGLALTYALAVGASRLYLGDHYPTDVLGSYLDVAAVLLLVGAATDLGCVRRLAARTLRLRELASSTGDPGQGAGRGT